MKTCEVLLLGYVGTKFLGKKCALGQVPSFLGRHSPVKVGIANKSHPNSENPKGGAGGVSWQRLMIFQRSTANKNPKLNHEPRNLCIALPSIIMEV